MFHSLGPAVKLFFSAQEDNDIFVVQQIKKVWFKL